MSARAAAATVGTSARTASAGRALRALVSMIVRLPPGSDYAADGPGRWKLGLATWRYKGRADKARASAGNLRARCPLRAFAGELTRAETRSARRALAATRRPLPRGTRLRGTRLRGTLLRGPLLRGTRPAHRSGAPDLRLASREEQHGHDEDAQADGSEGRRVGGDQKPREPKQDGDGEWRSGMAMESNPSRDLCRNEADAFRDGEDTEIANERLLGEVLDQVCPGPPFRCRESIHLVHENANADSLQGLPGAVEDHKGHKGNPGHPCRGAPQTAQK